MKKLNISLLCIPTKVFVRYSGTIVTLLMFIIFTFTSCHLPKNENESSSDIIPMSGNPGAPDGGSDSEEETAEYLGTYSGFLPCPDCDGRKVEVALKSQMTFAKLEYCTKNGKEAGKHHCSGTYQWNPTDRLITLETDSNQEFYFFEDNNLIQLDSSGNLRTGAIADRYVLSR